MTQYPAPMRQARYSPTSSSIQSRLWPRSKSLRIRHSKLARRSRTLGGQGQPAFDRISKSATSLGTATGIDWISRRNSRCVGPNGWRLVQPVQPLPPFSPPTLSLEKGIREFNNAGLNFANSMRRSTIPQATSPTSSLRHPITSTILSGRHGPLTNANLSAYRTKSRNDPCTPRSGTSFNVPSVASRSKNPRSTRFLSNVSSCSR